VAISSNLARAYLQVDGGPRIECWFNPTEYTITKTNKWQPGHVVGKAMPPSQFGGGDPQKIAVDLLFDDTEAKNGDVRGVTDQLFKAMEVAENTATSKNSARPPMMTFGWGVVRLFKAVCESLTVQFIMFRADGTPIRALVKLQMTQGVDAIGQAKPPTKRKTNPTTRGIEGYRTHVVAVGETLQSVAFAMYGDATRWRLIAEANGVDDPMRVGRGTVLDIPILPN
jgi:nucleoid-associated protein YgaU